MSNMAGVYFQRRTEIRYTTEIANYFDTEDALEPSVQVLNRALNTPTEPHTPPRDAHSPTSTSLTRRPLDTMPVAIPASDPPSSQPKSSAVSAFPDGLKTTGLHDVIPSLVRPYGDFPTRITGPTVWEAGHMRAHPEEWVRAFTDEEVGEIGRAAEGFMAGGAPLTGMKRVSGCSRGVGGGGARGGPRSPPRAFRRIRRPPSTMPTPRRRAIADTQELFPLPTLAPFLDSLRSQILNSRGFILFRNIPVAQWGNHKSAVAYMGLGTYFGYFTSQNRFGHVLGHVKDLGEDPSRLEKVRIYRTNAKQYFHTDAADMVGLLCMSKALEGGESDVASTHAVFNYLQAHHPDAVRTLVRPIWYFDRKGERSQGQNDWYKGAVFLLENDDNAATRRVLCRFDPMNVVSLTRLQSGENPTIPPLSTEQKHAMKCLEDACTALALHMVLEPGDIQLLNNQHCFHARTAYKDWPAGSVDERGQPRIRRHLMRLWLSLPEGEGGWRLPYVDSKEKKRGGVQVDDTPPVCPLDAE